MLGMISLGVVWLCSGTRSEAEGKDSGTFLCAAFEREPHLSETVSISGPESLGWLRFEIVGGAQGYCSKNVTL